MIRSNFCADILADRREVEKSAAAESLRPFEPWYEFAYLSIASSIKFRIPEGGRLLGLRKQDLLKAVYSELRLPYETIAIEYVKDGGKYVISAHQFDDSIAYFMFGLAKNIWTPFPPVLIHDTSKDETRITFIYENLEPIAKRSGIAVSRLVDEYCGAARFFPIPAIELCVALTCKNVMEKTSPAPSALNKSRIRKGKVPFFEYKELVLDVAADTSSDRGAGLSEHASPRVHLRRGHVRRLPKGNIWVNASVVGDKSKGFIHKDYRVKAGAQIA